jgi:aminopeptidase N
MPSPSARAFAKQFGTTFAEGSRVATAELRRLRAAKTAIRDPEERAWAEEVLALVRDDRELDRIEVAPAKRALARLIGLEPGRLPAVLEHALHHAVPGANAHPRHYDLTYDVSQGEPAGPARAIIDLRTRAPKELSFEVKPGRLIVEDVRVRGRPVPFRVDGERLYVTAPGTKKLDVRFEVRATRDPNGSGLIQDPHNGNYSTLTWPYDTGALFPSNSAPGDGVTARVHVKLGPGQRLVGAGTDGKGPIRIDEPVPPYAIGFYAGEFTDERTIESKCGVKVTVHGHGRSIRPDVRRAYQKAAADALDFFSGWLGRYPYGDRFELVEVGGSLGGMENVGAVALMIDAIRSRSEARETAVHETAHHWFGNNLRIKNSGEFWMSESFTNYLTYRFLQKADGQVAYYKLLDRGKALVKDALRHRAHALEAPAYADVREIFTDVPYELGPWILRMMEAELGTERFDAMLAKWYRVHRFSPVDTREFLAFVKEKTGHDFARMFEAWAAIEAVPSFRDRSKIEGDSVLVDLKARTAIPAGMSIPLVIEGLRGEKKTLLIDPTKPERIDVGFRVKRLTWDPQRRVLADVE